MATVTLGGTACGDDNNAASPPTSVPRTSTTSAPEATTSPPAATDDAAVRAAYEAASRAFIEAAAIPDPDAASVLATHVDPMLEQRRTTLRGLKAEGKVIRYPTPSQYRIEVEELKVEGDIARLTVCVVDDGQRVTSGSEPVSGAGVTTVLGKAAMRRVDDAWKLAERSEEQRWDGVTGCADS